MKLNLRSIDLNLLTVFDSLMDTGKLSATAVALGMSQPAVSAALQRLRLTFDDALFIRQRSGMQPTPRARQLQGDIHEALQLVRRAVTAVPTFDPASADRHFTLIGEVMFESMVLGQLLNQLADSAPGLRVDSLPIQQNEPVKTLVDLTADLLLDYVNYDHPQLLQAPVGTEKLVVLAAADHPRIKTGLTMKDYLAEPHVILSRRHGKQTSLEYAIGQSSMERQIRASVQSFASMPIVVAQTHFLATVPERLGALYEQAYPVRCHLFPLAIEPIPLYMYWPRVLDRDPGHRWFRQQVSAVLA